VNRWAQHGAVRQRDKKGRISSRLKRRGVCAEGGKGYRETAQGEMGLKTAGRGEWGGVVPRLHEYLRPDKDQGNMGKEE